MCQQVGDASIFVGKVSAFYLTSKLKHSSINAFAEKISICMRLKVTDRNLLSFVHLSRKVENMIESHFESFLFDLHFKVI